MNKQSVILKKGFMLFLRILIFVLAGLLIFYHTTLLYELYLGNGTDLYVDSGTTFEYIQSVLRVVIVISLLLVTFGKRWALWGMWIGIASLVATQYWAHFGHLPVNFTEGRHPLSYLKGFIFPTIITTAFYLSNRLND